jgi:hypothetical protein
MTTLVAGTVSAATVSAVTVSVATVTAVNSSAATTVSTATLSAATTVIYFCCYHHLIPLLSKDSRGSVSYVYMQVFFFCDVTSAAYFVFGGCGWLDASGAWP